MTEQPRMTAIVLRLSDLLPNVREAIDEARNGDAWNDAQLQTIVRGQFDFLGPYVSARILRAPTDEFPELTEGDDWLILEYIEPAGRNPADGERRYQRLAGHANRGRVKEVLRELEGLVVEFPAVAKYRRTLGQAHLVLQNFSRAEDELLRGLALDPRDADALTLLGNLYARLGRPADAVPLYERSLALQPNVYAMNNLGAAFAELGDTRQAVSTLRTAASLDETYANTWFGLGLALSRLQDVSQLPEAIAALERCLRVIPKRDEAPQLFDSAQRLLDGLSGAEALEEVPHAEAAIRSVLAEITVTGGFPVRVEEQNLGGLLARIELGWVHERDYHRLVVNTPASPQREHHILHELQHLQLIDAARAVGRNRWFASSQESHARARESVDGDVQRLRLRGVDQGLLEMVETHIDGLRNQLYNFPIDLLIETRLLSAYPQCRELLYRSVKAQLEAAAGIAHNADLRAVIPKMIFHSNAAMNGAMALWLEDQFPRRTNLLSRFQQIPEWATAKKLYAVWKAGRAEWSPGSEYEWVDSWAEILSLRSWYVWLDGNPA